MNEKRIGLIDSVGMHDGRFQSPGPQSVSSWGYSHKDLESVPHLKHTTSCLQSNSMLDTGGAKTKKT